MSKRVGGHDVHRPATQKLPAEPKTLFLLFLLFLGLQVFHKVRLVCIINRVIAQMSWQFFLHQHDHRLEQTATHEFSRTEDVKFDNYSLIVRGQRLFLHSGEFHTWRLPVPSLWPDILEKAKAAGLSAISIYVHMGLSNPSRGVTDFEGFRALKPLYEAAMAAGLWVVVRPGPYINAETSAGGIAHWVTTEVGGRLRTNDSEWSQAWTKYIEAVVRETAAYQIHRGGPVIGPQQRRPSLLIFLKDNEFTQNYTGHGEYYEELLAAFRNGGIEVPLTYNDPNQAGNFINGTVRASGFVSFRLIIFLRRVLWISTGEVPRAYCQLLSNWMARLDSYPQRFDCSHPSTWRPVVDNYHEYHQRVNPSQPWYIPEFQAGSFDAWGPNSPGYGPCGVLTGPDFQSVFNMDLWASNAKLINYYMLYGYWDELGWPSFPVSVSRLTYSPSANNTDVSGVYTSYDYGAAISESRALTSKYDELKLQGMFIRSSPEFAKTEWVADSRTGLTVSSNPAVFVTKLQNPDSGAGFWVARQTNSISNLTVDFKLLLETLTAGGNLWVPLAAPALTLSGREAKTIVTDYHFGTRPDSLLVYSTARIFFAGTIGNRDVLLLHGRADQSHEFAMTMTGVPNPWFHAPEAKYNVVLADGRLGTVISILSGTAGGLITIHDSDTQLVLFADSETAQTFWAPGLSSNTDPFGNFWGIGTNSSVLVGGPYLVRSATLGDNGTSLALRGDLAAEVRFTAILPPSIRRISWNGIPLGAPDSLTSNESIKSYRLPIRASATSVVVPELTGWRYADSLPEADINFDDTKWTVANRTETNVPQKRCCMAMGAFCTDAITVCGCLTLSYSVDLIAVSCENIVLWRGHFNVAQGHEPTHLNLSINGGQAFAASVWLNENFLGTSYGNSTNNMNVIEETDDKFLLPGNSLRAGENVVTVVQDNMGLNETDGNNADSSRNPRGIRGFSLDRGQFGSWKVQGKVGGYTGQVVPRQERTVLKLPTDRFPDKTRGIFNEGGLFGERRGWHLPGFDTSSWLARELDLGIPGDVAGIAFFITDFTLSIQPFLDVHLSFHFEDTLGQPYRAYLFVNGWMMGKRIANLGPQAKFPVHQGILDYQGQNTVAVALWAMEDVPVRPKLRLIVDQVYDSALEGITSDNPPWSNVGREYL
ncbi:BetaGal-dom2 domain-containing protein [Mycena indigotica]|uniref:beta-galactosidase n=1 Tax=Mycena indigotica TaxID=2126181 RepID=A0A8H6T068_9AGAR|nr:BetaGal-dom2 domain-containing protein [Mycena indigotica]KAF7309268.1 BetaGal-dom2 domain-containing protein [Mycena indigotica]